MVVEEDSVLWWWRMQPTEPTAYLGSFTIKAKPQG